MSDDLHIPFNDFIKGHSIGDIPTDHEINLAELQKRVNALVTAYGKPMKVTSGYRFPQDQIRIYSSKGVPRDKSQCNQTTYSDAQLI